jgi:hypothetical protein
MVKKLLMAREANVRFWPILLKKSQIQMSWSALKTALTETRGAFDRANQAAQEAFKQAV